MTGWGQLVGGRHHEGRPLRLLTMVEEDTREGLAIEGARSLRPDAVILRLTDLVVEHGQPDYIRSAHGPEFPAKAVRQGLTRLGGGPWFIDPGSPWENGSNARVKGKLRDARLNGEIFYTGREAQVRIEGWRQEYTHIRPHSSLGYKPPAP